MASFGCCNFTNGSFITKCITLWRFTVLFNFSMTLNISLFSRTCPCGKTKKTVKCGNPVGCTETCDKPLSCGEHKCKSLCHEGSCDECDVIHQQTCFCPRNKLREIQCGKVDQAEVKIGGFSCEEKCQKIIECGNHKCSQPCHPGKHDFVRKATFKEQWWYGNINKSKIIICDVYVSGHFFSDESNMTFIKISYFPRKLGDCGQCDRDVALVSRCPCGKKSLSEMGVSRKTCLDDIPSCGSMCGKKLSCGQVGKNHVCQSKCHTGPCPPCTLTTKVSCHLTSLT